MSNVVTKSEGHSGLGSVCWMDADTKECQSSEGTDATVPLSSSVVSIQPCPSSLLDPALTGRLNQINVTSKV